MPFFWHLSFVTLEIPYKYIPDKALAPVKGTFFLQRKKISRDISVFITGIIS